jgi:putative ABC transport system permease protein
VVTGEIVQVAFAAILTNKLRAFLTMLGIVIGVAAVITMVALGTGAQRAVEERIQALGTDLLSIYSGQQWRMGVARGDRVSLTTDDADALERDGYALKAVVPELSSNQQVKYGNRNVNVSVVGSTADYHTVNSYEIESGEMFSHGDDDARRRVAVLGYGVPGMLNQNGAAMIGQQVSIRGIPFEIVGVFAEKGSEGFSNRDEQILIPLETGRFRVFGTDRLRSLNVQVMHPDSMTVAMIGIERVLRREHGIQPGAANDFNIRNRTEFLSTAQETTQTFTFLLAGIAAVSLVVGGIGIMNIMLVSVTERTREIGVRKALGATRRNIMLQFLVEAVTLCMLGGVVGILLGAGGAYALAQLQGWPTAVSPKAVGMAFAFSAAVGIFFGLWPARRASTLDPIEALRYE